MKKKDDDSKQKEMQNNPGVVKGLLEQIGKFLSSRSVPVNNGWPVVTEEDMKQLDAIVSHIIHMRFAKDCDGDIAVEHTLVDRTKFEPLHYHPLPYAHKMESEEEFLNALDIAEMNLGVAQDRFSQLWKISRHRRTEKKDAKSGKGGRRTVPADNFMGTVAANVDNQKTPCGALVPTPAALCR